MFFFLYIQTEAPEPNNRITGAICHSRIPHFGDQKPWYQYCKGPIVPSTLEAYCFLTNKDRRLRLAPFWKAQKILSLPHRFHQNQLKNNRVTSLKTQLRRDGQEQYSSLTAPYWIIPLNPFFRFRICVGHADGSYPVFKSNCNQQKMYCVKTIHITHFGFSLSFSILLTVFSCKISALQVK